MNIILLLLVLSHIIWTFGQENGTRDIQKEMIYHDQIDQTKILLNNTEAKGDLDKGEEDLDKGEEDLGLDQEELEKDQDLENGKLNLDKDEANLDKGEEDINYTDISKTQDISKGNKQKVGRAKTFTQNLIIFSFGFLIALLSNFFTHMVRIYKLAVPQVKINMIFIMNYYIVELMNFILTFQNGAVMFSSLFCCMPLNVGLAVTFLIDYSGFILCGLVYSTAVLRLLFVVKFDLMVSLDPVTTSWKILGFTLIYTFSVQLGLFPTQLSSGYISPLNAFLTGQNATLAFNNYSIAHCVHTILCLAIIILSYYYIKYYLRKNHSLATVNAESGGPSKSMFNFKALITASVIGSIALILFAFTQKQTQDFPFGVMLSSFILLGININLACQNNIKEYFFLQVKKFVLTSSLKVTNPLKKKRIHPTLQD